MRVGTAFLKETWNISRKIRFVRLIRQLIEEGIMITGMREIVEEACRILSEMERSEVRERKLEDKKAECMSELYLLKVQGMQKNMIEDEVTVLRREIEEEKEKRKEAEKERDEEKRMKEEEKRKREEAERERDEAKREESKKKRKNKKRERESRGRNTDLLIRDSKSIVEVPKKKTEWKGSTEEKRELKEITEQECLKRIKIYEEERRRREEVMKSGLITSLGGTSVIFPNSDGIKRKGNIITHCGSNTSYRNCFIGGIMTSV